MFGHVDVWFHDAKLSAFMTLLFFFMKEKDVLKNPNFYHKLLKIHMQSIFPARGFSIILVYTTLVMFWTLRKCSDKM